MSGKALFFTAVLLLVFSGLVTWSVPIVLFATEPDIPPPALSGGTAPATPGTGQTTPPGSGGADASRSTPQFQPRNGRFVPPPGFPQPDFSGAPELGAEMAIAMAIVVGLILLTVIFLAKAFAIMGEPWWGAFVPIYNTYLMIRIAGRPGYWLLLLILPCIGIIVGIIISLDFVKPYGKGPLAGLLLLFFPFFVLPYIVLTSSPPSAWNDAVEA
ncbi:MAG: DUF5684 domain-containing protein [Planctomycetota bacterium]